MTKAISHCSRFYHGDASPEGCQSRKMRCIERQQMRHLVRVTCSHKTCIVHLFADYRKLFYKNLPKREDVGRFWQQRKDRLESGRLGLCVHWS